MASVASGKLKLYLRRLCTFFMAILCVFFGTMFGNIYKRNWMCGCLTLGKLFAAAQAFNCILSWRNIRGTGEGGGGVVGGLSTRLLARKLATIVAQPQNGNHKKFYENF